MFKNRRSCWYIRHSGSIDSVKPKLLFSALLFTLSATGMAIAERTYLYQEADGTVWYTNIKPRAQDSSRFTLLDIQGRAPAVVSCKAAELAQRASRYQRKIQRHAAINGVDANLIRALIRTESCFNSWAISSAGAQGLMQLMPATARELGATNPFEPEQNIGAGTRYIASMLKRFDNDLSLALAAYNAGPGAVSKHGGIPPYAETQAYVKKVMTHYQRYAGSDQQ